MNLNFYETFKLSLTDSFFLIIYFWSFFFLKPKICDINLKSEVSLDVTIDLGSVQT